MQHKLVTLTTEKKKKKRKEQTDVRAPESAGVNSELALVREMPGGAGEKLALVIRTDPLRGEASRPLLWHISHPG